MRSRQVSLRAALVALSVVASVVAWPGPAAAQTTELLAGKRLTLKQARSGERLSIVSRDALVAPLPGGTDDPTRMGAVLWIGNPATGEWAHFLAPAAGWSLNSLGTVFRFQAGRTPRAAGSVRKLVIRHGKRLKIQGTAVGLSLDEPSQGSLAVVLATGSRRYCLLFAGSAVRRDQPRRFSARNAPAPASCPAPAELPVTTTTTSSTTSTTARTTSTSPRPPSTSTSSTTSSTSGPGPTVSSTSTSSSSSSSSTGAPTTAPSTSVTTSTRPPSTTSSTSSTTSSSSSSIVASSTSSSSSSTTVPPTSTTLSTRPRFTCGGFALICNGTCPPGLRCRGGLVRPCECEFPG